MKNKLIINSLLNYNRHALQTMIKTIMKAMNVQFLKMMLKLSGWLTCLIMMFYRQMTGACHCWAVFLIRLC